VLLFLPFISTSYGGRCRGDRRNGPQQELFLPPRSWDSVLEDGGGRKDPATDELSPKSERQSLGRQGISQVEYREIDRKRAFRVTGNSPSLLLFSLGGKCRRIGFIDKQRRIRSKLPNPSFSLHRNWNKKATIWKSPPFSLSSMRNCEKAEVKEASLRVRYNPSAPPSARIGALHRSSRTKLRLSYPITTPFSCEAADSGATESGMTSPNAPRAFFFFPFFLHPSTRQLRREHSQTQERSGIERRASRICSSFLPHSDAVSRDYTRRKDKQRYL